MLFERAEASWPAFAPDLPGCVAAGDTREETEQLLGEAIVLDIAGIREDGEPVPPPVTEAALVAVAY